MGRQENRQYGLYILPFDIFPGFPIRTVFRNGRRTPRIAKRSNGQASTFRWSVSALVPSSRKPTSGSSFWNFPLFNMGAW